MRICVTGGLGYVGSLLVPALLQRGHEVVAWDVNWFKYELRSRRNLTIIAEDLSKPWGCLPNQLNWKYDAVIHLACVANDPCFDLNPELGKRVNYDATVNLVNLARKAGVKRFIYASSSSVYGVKPADVRVTEELPLEPLTDYSKYKALCEDVVLSAGFPCATVLRPATLCGYAPRQRLDLIVNILTTQAVLTGRIPVTGGEQYRPNLHIKDMVRTYLYVLAADAAKVAGRVFNVGASNSTVFDLAKMVQRYVGGTVDVTATNDQRSYRIDASAIKQALGFEPHFGINEAITDLAEALRDGRVPNALDDPKYYNVKQMQACHIS